MNDRSGFHTATRIAAGDDGTNYDNVAISLHWLTALLVLFQFASGEIWDYFPRATRETMQGLHVSLGVILTAGSLAGIVWRLIPGHQRPSIVSGWVESASKSVHYFLYVLFVGQAGLGFAFRWAQGHPVSVFGLFAVPSPLGAVAKATHTIGDIHDKVGWAIIIIAFAHALSALCHHYGLHDRVLGAKRDRRLICRRICRHSS